MKCLRREKYLIACLVAALVLSACTGPANVTPRPAATAAGATFTPDGEPSPTAPPPATETPDATATPDASPTVEASPTETSEPGAVTADDVVNVRGGPGTNYQIVGQLNAGDVAAVTGRNADSSWWQIVFEAGVENRGWVKAEFVTANDAAADAPVVEEVSPPTQPPAATQPPTTPRPTQPPVATNTPVSQFVYAVPALTSPVDGRTFNGQFTTITLFWTDVGPLAQGDCYSVRITHNTGVYDTDCLSDTSWTVQEWLFEVRPEDRTLYWAVRVMRGGQQVSPWSETWGFVWFGG